MNKNTTMPHKSPTNVPFVRPALPHKVIYTVLAVVFVAIGVAGLVIPIIPGILFIIGAIYLLSKVSSRVHSWSEQQAWMSPVRVRMIQLGGLRPLAKTRFVLLLVAKQVVTGLHAVTRTVSRYWPQQS
ncbi:MAG: DUF454 family protein [Pseudomonadales bacterium]